MQSEKQNLSFSQKHPTLNTLLGLVLVIIFFVLIIFVLKFLTSKAIQIIIRVSKLDAVIIVALITSAVSIVSVIVSSVVSKIIDYKQKRNEYLNQKREEPYSDFVEMVYKLQENAKNRGNYSTDEIIKDTYKFSKKLTLWGSDNVINKWLKFREMSLKGTTTSDLLFVMEDIIFEMRKDLGLKKLKKGNLLGFFINDIKDFTK